MRARPSQCVVCGCFEACLSPTDPRCAELAPEYKHSRFIPDYGSEGDY